MTTHGSFLCVGKIQQTLHSHVQSRLLCLNCVRNQPIKEWHLLCIPLILSMIIIAAPLNVDVLAAWVEDGSVAARVDLEPLAKTTMASVYDDSRRSGHDGQLPRSWRMGGDWHHNGCVPWLGQEHGIAQISIWERTTITSTAIDTISPSANTTTVTANATMAMPREGDRHISSAKAEAMRRRSKNKNVCQEEGLGYRLLCGNSMSLRN